MPQPPQDSALNISTAAHRPQRTTNPQPLRDSGNAHPQQMPRPQKIRPQQSPLPQQTRQNHSTEFHSVAPQLHRSLLDVRKRPLNLSTQIASSSIASESSTSSLPQQAGTSTQTGSTSGQPRRMAVSNRVFLFIGLDFYLVLCTF